MRVVAIGKRRATYEDLCKVPDTMVAEIIDGELIATPRPASPHARATSVLAVDLGGPFDRPPGDPAGAGGWWLLFEPELHLGPDARAGDLAGALGALLEHVAAVRQVRAGLRSGDPTVRGVFDQLIAEREARAKELTARIEAAGEHGGD